ncbi:hypothetical protein JHK82_027520 [Glycine max]|nr:hypothetical protein JHK87_027410 [Glycine soja]KAG5126685.1 hypothetical protein JHK82_027520 [Glycine max]
MDDESEVGREIRANHAKLRDFLGSPNLEFACLEARVRCAQGDEHSAHTLPTQGESHPDA